MTRRDESVHLSARVPGEVLDEFDEIAAILDRPRTWVVLRALRQYLGGEGAEILRDAESLTALDRGEGHDIDAVLDQADAIIAKVKAKRRSRAAE